MAAYMVPVLIGLAALVLEFNQLRVIHNELQAAVDAASMAGVLRAEIDTEIIYENEYDSNGNLINITPTVENYTIINSQQEAFNYAYKAFKKNMDALGWDDDGSTRITVYSSDLYGEILASGMTDAITGNGVSDDRRDFSDVDQYYFKAEIHVKTALIAPAVRVLAYIAGEEAPVDDFGEIIMEADAVSRTKIQIE
ncbi:pilus assembly protein TadG-related protein [Chengkuizengella axinellae]|uniref:Pilus assembly protein TadG-related protein n=1 Tax=Chengkuizengella axinellae TaxID=3064388 RepID=A0ABT9J3D1_9BACL|nr:pilus assembly protein TadG-related protein [Chengkuizengella sp. 2205SS18-9]MDP5276116.1 pilus assembly protein TadG-related protein [Chengkuizengella sp. 2205SS18-9]